MKPCTECPHYSTCTELCPEAEAYVNQDNKRRREPYETDPHDLPEAEEAPELIIPDKRDRRESARLKILIVQLHMDGMSSREIAYHLPCSSRYIRRVVGTILSNNVSDFIE